MSIQESRNTKYAQKKIDSPDCNKIAYKSNEMIDEGINLRELLELIKASKYRIFFCVAMFALSTAFYIYTLPNIFKAEVTLNPANAKSNSLQNSLMNQLGGLASFAGVTVAGGGNQSVSALATLESRAFLISFIRKNNLEIPLIATKYDWYNSKHVIDDNIYNKNTKKWINNNNPSDFNLYNKFSSLLTVSQDIKTNLVFLKIEWHNPEQAAYWANALIEDLNEKLRHKEKLQAERAIVYLKKSLESTNLVNMQKSIFQLIESQLKTVMLADSKKEFAFNIIDPALTPEVKSSPNRPLILVISIIAGLIFGVTWELIKISVQPYYRIPKL